MITDITEKMTILRKVRDRVRSYFNPDVFDAQGFRATIQMALLAMALVELNIHILLRQSALLGELPTYMTDVLIISISTLEFFLGPVIGWLGSNRRRTIMVMWVFIALVCILPVFGIPSPLTEADTALCTMQYRFLPSDISPRAAVRLSILVLAGISCALGRQALTAHALAYLDEYQPSANTHMNLGIFLLVRVALLHVGTHLVGSITLTLIWLQTLAIVIKFLLVLIKLHTFPVVPPAVDKRFGSDRSLLRSLGRVLQSKLAVSQMLAMSLLSAAVWGFGSQEVDFTKAKFHIVAGEGMIWNMGGSIRGLFIIVTVIILAAFLLCTGIFTRVGTNELTESNVTCHCLSGFLYTSPVMPVYKKKRALRNAARMGVYCVILFVMMTSAVKCFKGPLAGMGETTYNQPACGLRCSCDRPWTSFSPVCDPDGMTTYFSPCHAGCGSVETAGELEFYSNCTCSAGGRATVGACGDGSCAAAYALHTLFFTCVALAAILGLTWQGTVMLESVDRRDKSVAVGIASGIISLFAFVGGHALYMWINDSTCASFRGRRCLWHSSQFVPTVGYTSAGLAAGSFLISMSAAIILQRQKKKEKREIEEVDLSRD